MSDDDIEPREQHVPACLPESGCTLCYPNEIDDPSVIGADFSPMPSRLRWWRYNAGFYCKRLWVCVLCFWYLRHWPWGDLSVAEWRFQLADATARDAFLEGWCRE